MKYENYGDDDYYFDRLVGAIESLEEVLKGRKSNSAEVIPPKWVKEYRIGSEHIELEILKELLEQEKEISERIERQNSVTRQFDQLKMLLFESGKNLESLIEMVFTNFGYTILKSKENRDDLIIKYYDEIAVIEIKGVNGSAGENHAAQLEKWVTEYMIDYGVLPKGVLIVNTFREKPLYSRIEKDFPDQMLKFSVRREHCLMTTAQLLELYLCFTAGDMSFDSIHNLIFKTIGTINQELTKIKQIAID